MYVMIMMFVTVVGMSPPTAKILTSKAASIYTSKDECEAFLPANIAYQRGVESVTSPNEIVTGVCLPALDPKLKVAPAPTQQTKPKGDTEL
jgi:hypothetical protein